MDGTFRQPPLQARSDIARWMTIAFVAAAVVALLVLAVVGHDERGTDDALIVTARLSFVLFWLAYTGSALATLFGPRFQPIKRRGREFGLAFASAHTVHIALVAWLCWIGAAPVIGVFIFFGIALIFMYLLALASIGAVRRVLGQVGWRVLQVVGMNYIAYAFAVDFFKPERYHSLKFIVAYLPFAALSVIGPALVVAALVQRAARAWGPALPAVMPHAIRRGSHKS